MNPAQESRKRGLIEERKELQRKADGLSDDVNRISAVLSVVEKQIFEISQEIRDIDRLNGPRMTTQVIVPEIDRAAGEILLENLLKLGHTTAELIHLDNRRDGRGRVRIQEKILTGGGEPSEG